MDDKPWNIIAARETKLARPCSCIAYSSLVLLPPQHNLSINTIFSRAIEYLPFVVRLCKSHISFLVRGLFVTCNNST